MPFLNKTVEEEMNKFMCNHSGVNGKISIKMTTLKKFVRESISCPPPPTPLKRPTPVPYFYAKMKGVQTVH